MKIFVGADHAGFGMKEKIKTYLLELGHEVEDKGAMEYNEVDDYPDFIIPVAHEVSMHPNEVRGIVFGGSGEGEAMAANRLRGVRATTFYGNRKYVVSPSDDSPSIVQISRQDNDSNLLSIGTRFVTEEEIRVAVKEWLETPFKAEEKYERRILKMDHIHE